MANEFVQLSKVMSHALRHEPWVYELELDDEGWVPVESLLAALRTERSAWQHLAEKDLHAMMAAAQKQRFEISGGRIRALYGHSLPGKLKREVREPPRHLYHGTSPEAATQIRKTGLLPMARQFVHLSADRETAVAVGTRKSPHPIILIVRSFEAHNSGVRFYLGNDKVWLADNVPPQFIDASK